MSGSGGFYKYRCKYFYTHNCPNWVWVNNSPCAACLAEGRDSEEHAPQPAAWGLSKEIYVPQVHDGTLHYTLMEIVATDEPGNYWALRLKPTQPLMPPTTLPAVDATSFGHPSSTGMYAYF